MAGEKEVWLESDAMLGVVQLQEGEEAHSTMRLFRILCNSDHPLITHLDYILQAPLKRRLPSNKIGK